MTASCRGASPGRESTLAQVFADHAPVVFRVLRRWGATEADAEDLCQEVFMVVQRRMGEFEGRSSVRTWVLGIARRVLSDHRRRAIHRYEERGDAAPELAVAPLQARAVQASQQLARLDRALTGLGEEGREVFVLYEIEQMTIAEIVDITGSPRSTVFSRLQVARQRVREAVASDAPGVQDEG